MLFGKMLKKRRNRIVHLILFRKSWMIQFRERWIRLMNPMSQQILQKTHPISTSILH